MSTSRFQGRRGRKRRTNVVFSRSGRPRKRARTNIANRGLLGMELKFLDETVLNRAVTDANVWTLGDNLNNGQLLGVKQGDGALERDGRNYVVRSIHIKGYFNVSSELASAVPLPDVFVKFALILDKQTNGAQMSPTIVFKTTAVPPYLEFRDLENSKRFTVLAQRTIRIGSSNVQQGTSLWANGLRRSHIFNINKTFKGGIKMMTALGGVTAVVNNMKNNSFHIIFSSSYDAVNFTYGARLRFEG